MSMKRVSVNTSIKILNRFLISKNTFFKKSVRVYEISIKVNKGSIMVFLTTVEQLIQVEAENVV